MTLHRTDDLTARLLAHPTAVEARAWLTRTDGIVRTFGESDSPEQCIAFVAQLYDAGAVAVIATEIDTYERQGLAATERFQNTGHLIIKLPADASRRAGVFQLHAQIVAGLGFDPMPDVGQEYLYCPLD
jgi:hypothetical protein